MIMHNLIGCWCLQLRKFAVVFVYGWWRCCIRAEPVCSSVGGSWEQVHPGFMRMQVTSQRLISSRENKISLQQRYFARKGFATPKKRMKGIFFFESFCFSFRWNRHQGRSGQFLKILVPLWLAKLCHQKVKSGYTPGGSLCKALTCSSCVHVSLQP